MLKLKDDEVLFNGYDKDNYTILKYKDIKSVNDFITVPHESLDNHTYTIISFPNGNTMSLIIGGNSVYGKYDIWESISSPDWAFRSGPEECFETFQINYNQSYVKHTCEHCGITRTEIINNKESNDE